MIRYFTTCFLVLAFTTTAWAQQQEYDETGARTFVEALAVDLAKDPEAYMERLSFPVQVSVVTAEGELLTGTFTEKEYKLLGYMPGEQIRLHSAQDTLLRQMRASREEARTAEEYEFSEEEAVEEETVIEEELAVMPRQKVLEHAKVSSINTQVQFLNENVAFVRTTLAIGETTLEGQQARKAMLQNPGEEDDTVVEEELPLTPQHGQAVIEIGALIVRENGKWLAHSIITGETLVHEER